MFHLTPQPVHGRRGMTTAFACRDDLMDVAGISTTCIMHDARNGGGEGLKNGSYSLEYSVVYYLPLVKRSNFEFWHFGILNYRVENDGRKDKVTSSRSGPPSSCVILIFP